MKNVRRIFGVLDTTLASAICIVATYWLTYVIDLRYIRVIDKSLEDNSDIINKCLWVLCVAIVLIWVIHKYIRLKQKEANVSIIWFIGFIVVFVFILQYIITAFCYELDVMKYMMDKIGDA